MKQKTSKTLAKRIKVTKGKKMKMFKVKAGRRHLLTNKKSRTKKLGKSGRMVEVKGGIKKIIKRLVNI